MNKYAVFTKSLIPVIIISIICSLYMEYLAILNIAMIYMLPILFTALRYGQLQTLVVSIFATILFDLLFIPPYYKFSVYDSEYLISFVIMIIIGQLVSVLASKAAKAKELETSEKLHEAVLGSLSHELRTPLAIVIGAMSSLLSKQLELTKAERLELCNEAYSGATIMQGLVENLLTSARFESGTVKTMTSVCSVGEVVSSALLRVEEKYSKICN
jgi:two-component system sensor histidine kinase KdpD